MQTYDVLQDLALPNVALISLHELENCDDALVVAKTNRTRIEYYWTLTPSLLLYLLRIHPAPGLVTYLDADLLFYHSPESLYTALGTCSVGLIEHRYAPRFQKLAHRHGIYNVGMMPFRNDQRGRAVLEWWRSQCIDSCNLKPEDGKFGDQKYLDDWPVRFKGVMVFQHYGADLAPWNIENYRITSSDGILSADTDPVLFYHFHGLYALTPWLYCSRYRLTKTQVELIYRPYLRALDLAFSQIRDLEPSFSRCFARPTFREWLSWIYHRKLTLIVNRPAKASVIGMGQSTWLV